MKFATKLIRHCPPRLRHVATLRWEIKNWRQLHMSQLMNLLTSVEN